MLKRTDIVDEKMLDDLKVVAEFDCRDWNCGNCPFRNDRVITGCASLEVKQLLDNYYDGKELIY